tara:strand:- start:25443 stop:27839 length:2397 start_codon:yes stop_codon:yes gene_type:complete
MVKIEIDGKAITVDQGSMIIEIADNAGIPIPRFCYHKKLSIAANCRMCLVDVENAPKPLPACATPVTDGMKIHTRSKRAIEAQQGVMEFLLINHPLDCPVCDQGGQCELQDVALGYGQSYSNYSETKRSVEDKDLGSLINTDMTRCIHCTRCVRFGQEISGMRELGATGRGEHMQIGTYIENSVDSELSGNVIDLCPVGALTSKPFLFKARAWELMAGASVGAHDCVGSNIYYHTHRGKVIRAVPRENEKVNEVWISDRDRYSYEALYEDRLDSPLIKENGEWRAISWEEALPKVIESLDAVIEHSPAALGAFVSPNATTEESYLIQKLLRNKNCHNIDHRLRQVDFRHQDHQTAPYLGDALNALESIDNILLIGSDVRFEAPMISTRIFKAHKQGSAVFAVNPLVCRFNFDIKQDVIAEQGDLVGSLLAVIKAWLEVYPDTAGQIPESVLSQLSNNSAISVYSDDAKLLVEGLVGQSKHILLGAYAWSHPDAANIYYLSAIIAKLSGASMGEVSNGANSTGCWVSGAIPHQSDFATDKTNGLNTQQMLDTPLSAYLLFNVDPEFDFASAPQTLRALSGAKAVISFSVFDSPSLRAYADIILPIAPHTETPGSFINIQGDWQSFASVTQPYGNSKPLWKILRVLGSLWDMPEMKFDNLTEIQTVLKQQYQNHQKQKSDLLSMPLLNAALGEERTDKLLRLAPTPIYAVDSITRRAKALQATVFAQTDKVLLNSKTAEHFGFNPNDVVYLTENGRRSEDLVVVVDPNIPDMAVLAANNIEATRQIGASYGFVDIHKQEG